MFGFGVVLVLVAIFAVAAILAFEIWMFVDAVRNPRLSDNERIAWLIGMLLFHPVVAIVYYFVVYNNPPRP